MVDTITYDEAEQIILATEPAAMSDKGDKIWTRRMAVALADVFNARLSSAALSGMAEPVKVKPLEWLERDYYYAYVPTFPTGYCVSFEDAKHWLTLDGIRKVGEDTFRGPYPSRDEAVAAAQTDYERRILSALATPPASEREEIERLRALLSRTQRHLKLFEGTSGYRDGEIQLLRDVSAALQTEGK